MVKLICIDFDGTLVDSVPHLFDAYKTFAHACGFSPSHEEFERLSGVPLELIIDSLQRWHNIEGSYKELLHLYAKEIATRLGGSKLFPGAHEFLEWATQQGMILSVVTSSRKPWVESILKNNVF
jgi:Predicted phosphatase/phosphohexomutase